VSQAVITWIGGPVLRARMTGPFSVYEAISVGPRKLLGEVIQLRGEELVAQVYEDTTGLEPGVEVTGSGRALSVSLGPGLLGGIFDGLLRPLTGTEDFQIQAGIAAPAVGRFRFTPSIEAGTDVAPGAALGTVAAAREQVIRAPRGASSRSRRKASTRRTKRSPRWWRPMADGTRSRCDTPGRCARRAPSRRASRPAHR
jgi:vacuolar-type H+-ATPase catalytic subunit A/Vma1